MWKGERGGTSVVKGSLETRGRGGLRQLAPPQHPHKLCFVELWSPRARSSGWMHPHPRVIRSTPPSSILLFEPALDFRRKKVSVAKTEFGKHFSDFSAHR